MINLFLDAAVLAPPSAEEPRDVVREYFEVLAALYEVLNYSWASLLIMADTAELLMRSGSYPLWDTLKALAAQFGSEFQPRDVHILVDSILKKAMEVERSLGISAVLFDAYECNPATHLEGRDDILVQHFSEVSAMVTVAVALDILTASTQFIATPQIASDGTDLYVTFRLVDIEPSDLKAGFEEGHTFDATLTLLLDAFSLSQLIEPAELVCKSGAPEDLHQAIKFGLQNTDNPGGSEVASRQPLPFKFGPNFMESARSHGFLRETGKARKLLRAIVETLCGQALDATHWIRVDSGPEAEQLRRESDAAAAWRRDIDQEYHLHYWHTGDTIELADVVAHSNFKITS